MRRKDLKYYIKTAILRWKALGFAISRKHPQYSNAISVHQNLIESKLEETQLQYTAFQSYFYTYYYLDDTSIFDEVYRWEHGVPISLKSESSKNPLFPIYYGLVSWNTSKGTVDLAPILQQMNELGTKSELGFHWDYQDDFSLFGLKAPWKSGLTQSLGTCLYLRAYSQSQDKIYLERAKQAFAWNLVSIEQGGLLSATKAGLEWVEEYPNKPANHVLNGHIFAIIAAIELFQITEEAFYKFTADNWIKSLLHHLSEYQYKQYLLHNLKQIKFSNIEYQGLYVGLFKHLYRLTQHPLFHEFHLFYNDCIDWDDFNRFYGIAKE